MNIKIGILHVLIYPYIYNYVDNACNLYIY